MRHSIPKLEDGLIDSCKASEFSPVLDEQRGLFPPQPHLGGAFFSPVYVCMYWTSWDDPRCLWED